MTKKMRRLLSADPTIALLYRAVRAYAATFRLRVENERTWMDVVKNGSPVVICCWHQQFFSAIRHFRNYSPYRPPLMISRSADGELIAGVATRTGWDIVRGSSSRGGREALDEMVAKLRRRKIAGHIVDGPRGPAGIVKAGVIRLAQLAEAVIVPFYVTADRAWYFTSWDRFMLPKPFAKVRLRFGEAFFVPQTGTPEEFEQLRLKLENTMRPGLITPE
ncbi:MAG: lysophospholipid acyltransferase family protein [Thermodesulfobacteriota bacterium]